MCFILLPLCSRRRYLPVKFKHIAWIDFCQWLKEAIQIFRKIWGYISIKEHLHISKKTPKSRTSRFRERMTLFPLDTQYVNSPTRFPSYDKIDAWNVKMNSCLLSNNLTSVSISDNCLSYTLRTKRVRIHQKYCEQNDNVNHLWSFITFLSVSLFDGPSIDAINAL